MEAGKRLHLTTYALKNPRVPPAFCMALRKHLRGAWISNIEQHDFERVITIYFKTKKATLRIILELFGEGNIILTDEKGEILQALIFKRMRDRNILRHEIFQFPPSIGKNPLKVTREELEEALKTFANFEVVRAIARFLGVGGFYAEEILLRANIEKTKQCNALNSSEVNAIFNSLKNLISKVTRSETEPNMIIAKNGSFLDVLPFKLKRYETYNSESYNSFNEALDEFYLRTTAVKKAVADVEADRIKREVERLKRIITEQEQALREDESKAELNKRIGNVIFAHFNELQALLNSYSIAKGKKRDFRPLISENLVAKGSSTTQEAFVKSFDARNKVVNVSLDELHFSLNLRETLFENAANYYERGKKAKQKSAGALRALKKSRTKLHEVKQRLREAEVQKTVKPTEIMEEFAKRKVKPKEWYEKFRWFISSDGFLVVAGKDAVSNEVLVKKYAGADDVVFHADVAGAPFVVVKTKGKVPSGQVLREAGEFAAAFSRAWREGVGSADVYWVKPEQLSKSGPSGEYVTRGAFAISGKRNWIRNVELKLAIGVVEGEETKFVGGPVETVKAKTKAYLIIVPGDLSGKELLKQILRALTLKLTSEQRERIGKPSIEQIREYVPYTKGRLAKTIL
jgi:predicted ribosome quality control (RQC) complex YloA/Tae2 family protein